MLKRVFFIYLTLLNFYPMQLDVVRDNRESMPIPKVISDFFDMYDLQTCDDQIWDLVTTYFSVPDGQLKKAEYRSTTIYFCQAVLALLKGLEKAINEPAKQIELSN